MALGHLLENKPGDFVQELKAGVAELEVVGEQDRETKEFYVRMNLGPVEIEMSPADAAQIRDSLIEVLDAIEKAS